jgi:drug/metabolite transporter (DMT)-like permease
MLTSATAYSLFTVFGKHVLKQLEPIDVIFWRFLIATPVSWAVVFARRARGIGAAPSDVAWRPRFLMGVLFGLLAYFAFAGLDLMSGALYVVIIYTYPAMVAIGAKIVGSRTSTHIWVGVGLTVVGIAFTVPEVLDPSNDNSMLGVTLTLVNAALYAGYILYSERIMAVDSGGRVGDGYVAAAWGMLGSLTFATLLVVVSGGVTAPSGASYVAAMMSLALVSTVVSITAFFMGVKHLGPAHAAVVASTEPILALTWLVLFGGESLVFVQLLGAVLVISGVFAAQRTPST